MDRTKKRNLMGIVGWFIISLVINALAFIPMVRRELKQKKELGLKEVEWDDILRYGITIVVGSCVQGLAVQYFCGL